MGLAEARTGRAESKRRLVTKMAGVEIASGVPVNVDCIPFCRTTTTPSFFLLRIYGSQSPFFHLIKPLLVKMLSVRASAAPVVAL